MPLDGEILIADPSPENRRWLKAHLGDRPLRAVSRDELLATIAQRHGAALLDQAVFGLARRFPDLSAQTVMTRGQGRVLGTLVALAVAGLVLFPWPAWKLLVGLLSLAFGASGIFRTMLAMLAVRRAPPPSGHVMGSLPVYTILVPLYRETAVLPHLVRGLAALEYPPHLLDIKLVLEADDHDTIAAAEALRPQAGFEIVRVPPGGPRTKPKAANYALAFARGEYLVVYDAEDRPEPDQLKKAIAQFRAASRHTACLQARLNFYNADHNWLTRGIMAQTPLAKA